MATIERFEDIESWKGGRDLVRHVYEANKVESFAHDWGLKDQIQRAAVSIMSNIAEGFERGTNKEFVQFLFIARASAGEVRSLFMWLLTKTTWIILLSTNFSMKSLPCTL